MKCYLSSPVADTRLIMDIAESIETLRDNKSCLLNFVAKSVSTVFRHAKSFDKSSQKIDSQRLFEKQLWWLDEHKTFFFLLHRLTSHKKCDKYLINPLVSSVHEAIEWREL